MEYIKGIYLDKIETQFGDIIKVGINKEKFNQNPDSNGWVNFFIKKSKEGIYYAQKPIDSYDRNSSFRSPLRLPHNKKES